MSVIDTKVLASDRGGSRWGVTCGWAGGLAAYAMAAWLAEPRATQWINDIAWTLASAAAAFFCLRSARALEAARRRAWYLIGAGCLGWLVGQLHWNYSQLALGIELPFPSAGQIFYSAFPLLFICGVLSLPEARQRTAFTLRHLGNIGLVSCCLVVIIVLGILEPAFASGAPGLYLWIAVAHTLLVAAAFLATLYALWTFRWSSSWTPMLLLVIGSGVYAVANLVYAHALLTATYFPNDLINVTWLVVFGLIAAAACEQRRLSERRLIEPPHRMLARERWLEAVVPALLIVIMVAVAVASSSLPMTRVTILAAGLFILFALILGAREAWIQHEAEQLTGELRSANEQLQAANLELRRSEMRYRELNAALEERVSERTTELKRAYNELEGFTYAVAHDLKAPLRAINGFAHLFEAELGGQLSGRAREHLARIRNGSLRMAKLIDDLLSYSHIDRRGLQASVVSMPDIVDSVVTQFGDEIQRRHISLTVEVEPVRLQVDAEGLLLTLRNLLENAIKYTRERSQAQIRIAARRGESGLTLTIADNGIGFDMEYREHIFKLFQRLHRDDQYPGTGIGLALVRKAVERIGGNVWAEGVPGQGAAFHVELPTKLIA